MIANRIGTETIVAVRTKIRGHAAISDVRLVSR